jgi:hypothetical protein
MTCIGYSKTRKQVAVGYIRQGDKRAYVGIHNVRNGDQKFKYQLTVDLFEGQEMPTVQKQVISVALSGDGQNLLVIVNGGTEIRAIAYRLSNNTGPWVAKVVCSHEFHPSQAITKCSFHPTDKSMVILMGPGFLQQYFITEEQLAPQDLPYTNLPRPMAQLQFKDFDFTEDY